jgi:hypothetical protein
MHLPVEIRFLDKNTFEKRHVYPKGEILGALEAGTHREVDTGRDGRQWWATVTNGSRADNERRRVYGATEREALQNLADKMRVKLPLPTPNRRQPSEQVPEEARGDRSHPLDGSQPEQSEGVHG